MDQELKLDDTSLHTQMRVITGDTVITQPGWSLLRDAAAQIRDRRQRRIHKVDEIPLSEREGE